MKYAILALFFAVNAKAGIPPASQPGAAASTTGVDAGEDASLDDLTVKTITSTGTAPSLTATGAVFTASVTVIANGDAGSNTDMTGAGLVNSMTGESGARVIGTRITASDTGISGQSSVAQLMSKGNNVMEIFTQGAAPLVFGVNSTEYGRFGATGNLGVGTASPLAKLSVVGDSSFSQPATFLSSVTAPITQVGGGAAVSGRAYQATDYFRMNAAGTGATDRAAIRWSGGGFDSIPSAPDADSNGDKMVFYNDGTGKVAQGIGSTYNMWFQSNGHASSGFRWWTSPDTTPLNQMSLTATGSLGVGDTTPDAKIESVLAASDQFGVQSSSQSDVLSWGVDKFGHVVSSGAAPAIGTCTNGAVLAGSTDVSGRVTFSGANSSCSITFAYAAQAAQTVNCTVSTNMATPALYNVTATGTTLTVVANAFANTDYFSYICYRNGGTY